MAVIGGSARRSSSSPVIATQMTPLPRRTVAPMSSSVAASAAKMMSPSFSRSASSTTSTGRPSAIASIALSMGSSRVSS